VLLVETLSPDQQPPMQVVVDQNGQPSIPVDATTGQPVLIQPPTVSDSPEQNPDIVPGEEDLDSDLDGGDDSELYNQQQEAPEMEPLKKYYLGQKVTELRAKLQEFNVRNNDLDIIIKFMDNLSYLTLWNLVNAVLPDIEETLMRLNSNEKQQPKQKI
jgi:hypothetical protein